MSPLALHSDAVVLNSCSDSSCSGQVLHCLQDHVDAIHSQDCRAEVLQAAKLEVSERSGREWAAFGVKKGLSGHGGGSRHHCLASNA